MPDILIFENRKSVKPCSRHKFLNIMVNFDSKIAKLFSFCLASLRSKIWPQYLKLNTKIRAIFSRIRRPKPHADQTSGSILMGAKMKSPVFMTFFSYSGTSTFRTFVKSDVLGPVLAPESEYRIAKCL
jgi:hypothetical protein